MPSTLLAVPSAIEPDFRALVTAATNTAAADQAVAIDPNNADFNGKVDAANQSNTALYSAYQFVIRDIRNFALTG